MSQAERVVSECTPEEQCLDAAWQHRPSEFVGDQVQSTVVDLADDTKA